jgi:hypothetical protein
LPRPPQTLIKVFDLNDLCRLCSYKALKISGQRSKEQSLPLTCLKTGFASATPRGFVCGEKILSGLVPLAIPMLGSPYSRTANDGDLCPSSNGGTRPTRKRRDLWNPTLYLLWQRRAICLRPERRQARKADRDQQSDDEQDCHEAGDPGPTLPRPEPSAGGPKHA